MARTPELAVLAAVVIISTLLTTEARPQRKNAKKVKFNDMDSSSNAWPREGFPETLHYQMDIEGYGPVELELKWNRFMGLPSNRKGNPEGDEVGIYTDTHGFGSFACRHPKDGELRCNMAGITRVGGDACYIADGTTEAECKSSAEGYVELIDSPETSNVIERSVPDDVDGRYKRSLLPSAGRKIIQLGFVMDAAFMQNFYDRHPGDASAAQAEAEMFATLLSNEVGQDFQWIADFSDNTILDVTRDFLKTVFEFVRYDLTDLEADHIFILTGLNLVYMENFNVIGLAFLNTVCARKSRRKFSINEYGFFDVGRIGAHEIGHALSAKHDKKACPEGKYIMSPYIFPVDDSTVATYSTFSRCSIEYFKEHITSDCAVASGLTDSQFQEAFCQGLPGQQTGSLDLQCQISTGWSGSYACNSVTGTSKCHRPFVVFCRRQQDTGGVCSGILSFVWNGTPCGGGKMCYSGYCMDEFDVCAADANPVLPSWPVCDCCVFEDDDRGECCSEYGDACECC